MKEITIKKRHRLKKKEAKKYVEKLDTYFGCKLNTDIELASSKEYQLIIFKNEVIAFILEEVPYLSLKGILKLGPERSFVTVDMGAVRFLSNGADVMAPGIVDADTQIEVGGPVWVRDVNNKKPLAVGKALISGQEMVQGSSGKAIKTLHYISDALWNLDL